MKKFWMVWSENGGAPNKKHDTFEAARNEATRIFNEKGGRQRFVILEAIGSIHPPAPPVPTWEDAE